MYRNNDIVYDAIEKLKGFTGVSITVDSSRKEYDAIISFVDKQLTVVAKTEIRSSNIGLILSEIKQIKDRSTRPIILIAKFISSEIVNDLKEKGINYLDTSGNAFVKEGDLYVYISGQKAVKKDKINQSRAFQEAGIKLIFNLLMDPDNLQNSYRTLSEQTGISVGSVSIIMKELEELNFILRTNSFRKLKNTKELLNRWIVAYHDVLRPRLKKKKMKFIKKENYNSWKQLSIENIAGVSLWGGEPAAAILTQQLQPAFFTIYTRNSWKDIVGEMALMPDEEGDIEVLQIFWDINGDEKKSIVPSILVYADLISSGIERNIETAKLIFDNELQYIK